jgi:hypothetical protein
MFLWVENPNLAQTDHAHYAAYFATMRRFMTTNCVGITVNRVVMKTPYPQYHFAYAANQKIFWPPAASPFFTELIAKGPRNVKYHLYPMITTKTRPYWASFSGTSDIGVAVFKFASLWNKFLIGQGYAGIGGVVVDYESTLPGDSFRTAAGVYRLKSLFPGIQFGAALGYDDYIKLGAMAPYTDHFFLEMYDWYRPTQGITLTANSPFVVNRNNAPVVANYVMNTAVQPGLWAKYAAAGVNKVHLMWSLQHSGTNCINLQGGSSCGSRNDFGSWSPAGFHDFLVQIKARIAALGIPGLSALEHGLFHYNAMSPSWL